MRRLAPLLDSDLAPGRAGWPVVLAGFLTALTGWGFGFYGQAVYLAVLQQSQGWPTALVAAATTAYYLSGALLLALVPDVIARLGPRLVVCGGAAILVLGALGLASATAPWQLFAANLVMAAGWASTSTTAIATILARWFDRRRGLAISLALNGASAAGFTVAPLMVQLATRWELHAAVLAVGAAMLAVLVPTVLVALRPPRAASGPPPAVARDTGAAARLAADAAKPAFSSRAEALRDRRFWSIAAPFALALVAQVGFLMHQVAFLAPRLGPAGTGLAVALTTMAAVAGRIGLGLVIDRLDQRRTAAVSIVCQMVGLGLMLAWPVPAALYAGCVLFGVSVGNGITLPTLIIQREMAARCFGLVVGLSTAVGQFAYAFAPGLLGLIHDLAGGYGPVLVACLLVQAAAALLVVRGRPLPASAAATRPA